jgi:hypothetical protein
LRPRSMDFPLVFYQLPPGTSHEKHHDRDEDYKLPHNRLCY